MSLCSQKVQWSIVKVNKMRSLNLSDICALKAIFDEYNVSIQFYRFSTLPGYRYGSSINDQIL
jgi:hypothetical protein